MPTDEILTKLIHIPGVKKLNISTDLKMAYKRGIEKASRSWSQPITASKTIHDEIMSEAVAKMKLLGQRK